MLTILNEKLKEKELVWNFEKINEWFDGKISEMLEKWKEKDKEINSTCIQNNIFFSKDGKSIKF